MKMLSVWLTILTLAVSTGYAEDSATQQQLDRLSAQIQDLQALVGQQNQKIDNLEKELSDLRDKVNTPVVTDYATHSELKSLADQVQEIDRKRQEDRELILQKIEDLAKIVAAAPISVPHSNRQTPKPTTEDTSIPAVPVSQKGHPYVIQKGDSLGLIVKAYREKGVKVTLSQVIAANPGLNPNVVIPGKTIFIPDPDAR